jgi:hypothetical protein
MSQFDERVQKAMDSFGSWENRTESSVDFVNQLREDKCRNVDGLWKDQNIASLKYIDDLRREWEERFPTQSS